MEFPSDPPFIGTRSSINGGAGKSLLDLILNLNRDKYSISIFSIGSSNKTQYEYIKPKTELYRYPTFPPFLNKRFSYLNKTFSTKFIFQPLRKELDLIHCQLGYFGADIAALNYKNRRNVPFLLSIRGMPKLDWKKFYKRTIMKIYISTIFRKALKISDKIVIQSKNVLKESELLKYYKEKIEIVPNGVDFKSFSKYNNDSKIKLKSNFDFSHFNNILLFVGSLSERKGIPILLDSFEKLLNTHPYTLLIIVGTGKMESFIIKKSRKKNFIKNILLIGYIQDKNELAKIYSLSDLLILPSTAEGFARVLLESMAAGTPCLVSNIGPNIGAIDDGRLGLIADRNNSDDFTYRIREFLNLDKIKKIKLIKKGIIYAKNHSWSKVAQQMEQIYEKMSS